MITKFKIYESDNFTQNYNVGDYLITNLRYRKGKDVYINGHVAVKVIDIKKDEFGVWYDCLFIDGYDLMIDNDYIIRRMTPEEIEEYKTRQNANKFGL